LVKKEISALRTRDNANLAVVATNHAVDTASSGAVDLVYVSRANGLLDTTSSMDSLVERARAANAAHGISGILVALNGNYLQWLQGPAERVTVLAANIKRDARHSDFVQLLHQPARHRLIQPWGGYTVERRETTSSARERVTNFSQSALKDSTFAPEDFMRSLCWPSVVAHDSENARPIRVVLFGATLMWTSAVITSASLKHNATTGRTRFSDVASQSRTETLVEYIDYQLAIDVPVRLMACEISSVHNNLAVSIFADADTLVFMIGSLNNDYLRDLVVSAAALCKQRPQSPRIVFLLARRTAHAEHALRELARESGFTSEVILVSTLADSREALGAIEQSLSFEIERRATAETIGRESATSAPSRSRFVNVAVSTNRSTPDAVQPRRLCPSLPRLPPTTPAT
jgi:Sensors of blue-light using FAD